MEEKIIINTELDVSQVFIIYEYADNCLVVYENGEHLTVNKRISSIDFSNIGKQFMQIPIEKGRHDELEKVYVNSSFFDKLQCIFIFRGKPNRDDLDDNIEGDEIGLCFERMSAEEREKFEAYYRWTRDRRYNQYWDTDTLKQHKKVYTISAYDLEDEKEDSVSTYISFEILMEDDIFKKILEYQPEDDEEDIAASLLYLKLNFSI